LPLLPISASCDVLDPVVSLVEHGPVRRYRRSTSAQHGKQRVGCTAPNRVQHIARPQFSKVDALAAARGRRLWPQSRSTA
jgi:hypothetical protein